LSSTAVAAADSDFAAPPNAIDGARERCVEKLGMHAFTRSQNYTTVYTNPNPTNPINPSNPNLKS